MPFTTKNATQEMAGSAGINDVNRTVLSQRSLSIPRLNQASKYVALDWEHYIAANLYMYIIPLAIFLRRARELDFSPSKYDRSIEVVQRVFRVFTPAVVDTISHHLRTLQYPEDDMDHQVKYHRDNLGAFAPPRSPMTLTSLKADMQCLLEEIAMHHLKKVGELDTFDWLVGKVEGIFGTGVVFGEEKTLEVLMERAKVITCLPKNCNILQQNGNSLRKFDQSTSSDLPTRTKDGVLTRFGRELLLSGTVKLNPDEVEFSGDSTRSKVRSYEIPVLVDLTLWASDALNERLGLTLQGKGKFKIDLRFFADYRNCLFAVVTMYFLLMIL
jgi:hypothetical protein